MADPRFYSAAGPFSLKELAEVSGAKIGDGASPDAMFVDVQPLSEGGPEHVSFFDNKLYFESFTESRAGACLARPEAASSAPEGMAMLLTQEPYQAYAKVALSFYPPAAVENVTGPGTIDETAKIQKPCRIDPGAVIGARVEIGKNCHIGANATLGPGVVLGDDCQIGPSASLAYCIVGNRVIIHAGAGIGQDGFGFAMGPKGHLKVPQLGRVLIGDDVEIGANCPVDRARSGETRIRRGTKIDNVFHIGHNCDIGEDCIMAAGGVIGGSTSLGHHVVLAGHVGIADHVHVGAGTQIAGKSTVTTDVPDGSIVRGIPAIDTRRFARQQAALRRLPKWMERLRDLAKRIEQLEQQKR